MPYPSHPWFDRPNNIWWNVQVMKLIIQPSTLLGPNILISTLFSHTLNLCSSLSVIDKVPRPRRTTGKIVVLYILIFKSLEGRPEDKRFGTEWYQAFIIFTLFLISWWKQFWFVTLVPKHLNSATFQRIY
jgi:hypothetical protein